MPSARAVGPLLQLLDDLEGEEPSAAVVRLERTDPPRLAALLAAVAGAYYMAPEVRQLIGYPGQEARTVDVMADLAVYVEEGLLDPVVERGPFYRQPGA